MRGILNPTKFVIEPFYFIFPLLGRAYAHRPWLVCIGLVGVAFGARCWVLTQPDTTMFVNQLPCMLDLYSCGMMAALGYTKLRGEKPGRPFAITMIFAVVACCIGSAAILCVQRYSDYELLRRGQLMWRFPLGILAAGFLLFGSLLPTGLQRAAGNRMTRYMASISYDYYIWHQFLACRLKDLHIPPYSAEFPDVSAEQPWQILYTLMCFAVSLFAAAAASALTELIVNRKKNK